MLLLALFFFPVRLYGLQLMPLCSHGTHPIFSIRKNFFLSSSKFDTNIDDLYLLSRIELQTLSKAYKLKANSKTDELIEQIKLFRENLTNNNNDNNLSNVDFENEILPSKEQILKVSPLEKSTVVDSLSDASTISKNNYGVKNADIGEVLKDQGVQIDDLLALRNSLMKGGFKFNSEDDDDFEFSGDDFNGSNIEEEFYDENYNFDDNDNVDSNADVEGINLIILISDAFISIFRFFFVVIATITIIIIIAILMIIIIIAIIIHIHHYAIFINFSRIHINFSTPI